MGVAVHGSKGDGELIVEHGVVDGQATARRLGFEIGRQLSKSATAQCPKAIAANQQDQFRCTVSGLSKRPKTVVVTIINDRTGDFTYQLAPK